MSNEKVTVTVESATAALDHVWGGPGWLPDDLRKAYASSYRNRPGLKIPTGVIIAIHEITIILTQRGDLSGLTGLWEPEGILRRAATRDNGASYLTVHAAEASLEQIRQTPTTIEPERNIHLDGDDEDENPWSPKKYARGSEIPFGSLESPKTGPVSESMDMEVSSIQAVVDADELEAGGAKSIVSNSPSLNGPQPLRSSSLVVGPSAEDTAAPSPYGISPQPGAAPATPSQDPCAGRPHKRKRVTSDEAHDAPIQDMGHPVTTEQGVSTLRVTENAPNLATAVKSFPGGQVQEDMTSETPFHTLLANTPISHIRKNQFLAILSERDAEEKVTGIEERLFEYRVRKEVEERLNSSMEKLKQTLRANPDVCRTGHLKTPPFRSDANGRVPSADSLVDEGQYLLEGAKLLHQGVIAEYGPHNNNLPKIQKRLAKARKELNDVRTKIDKRQLILAGKQYLERAQQALVEALGLDEATARAKNWFELLA